MVQVSFRPFFYAWNELIFSTNKYYFNELQSKLSRKSLGFVLAQYIMFCFKVYSESLLAINPVYSNNLWSVWDVVLDVFLASSEDESISKIFHMFIKSFDFFFSIRIQN